MHSHRNMKQHGACQEFPCWQVWSGCKVQDTAGDGPRELEWYQILGSLVCLAKEENCTLQVRGSHWRVLSYGITSDFYTISYKIDCNKVPLKYRTALYEGREYLGRCEKASWVSARCEDPIGLQRIDVEDGSREGDSRQRSSLSKSPDTEDLQGLFRDPAYICG